LKLAELCSKAVDYPKNGIPVDIQNSPHFLIRFKPDWHAAEVVNPKQTDFYESTRALGYLYRAIDLEDVSSQSETRDQAPLSDPISQRLDPLIREIFPQHCDPDELEITSIFQVYVDELRFICNTHTLSMSPGSCLSEEEVVAGTILAKCSQRRWRSDRIHSMRTHMSVAINEVRTRILPKLDNPPRENLECGLMKAWAAWIFSRERRNGFGASSFGLVVLGTIFDYFEKLGVELGHRN
jgi:RNA-dependent RNA polymerase